MSYSNLTNDEIVFLYQITKAMREQYESVIENEYVEQKIINGTDGSVTIQTDLPSDFIEEIKEGCHYKYLKRINNKLEPIYKLISESEPDVVEEVEKHFSIKKE